MTHLHVHTVDAAKRSRDPTRSNDLRSRLATYYRKAILAWQRDLRNVMTEDQLGLRSPSIMSALPSDRLERFSAFVDASAQQRIGSVDDLVSTALSEAYARGVSSGFVEAEKFQHNAPSNAQLYVQQAENDLRGIVQETSTRINRAAAVGIAGALVARRLIFEVQRPFREVALPRTRILANTLVTSAFNGGKLDTFEALGETHVGIVAETVRKAPPAEAGFYKKGSRNVIVEWLTAGDDRVCPECEELEGTFYTLAAARRLIPKHPNCRCSVEIASDFNPEDFSGEEADIE